MKLTDFFNRYTEMENCFQKKRVPEISRNHPVSGRTKTMDYGIKDCSNTNTIRYIEKNINNTSQSFSINPNDHNKSKGKNTPNRNNVINTSNTKRTQPHQPNKVKLSSQSIIILLKIKKDYLQKPESQI